MQTCIVVILAGWAHSVPRNTAV